MSERTDPRRVSSWPEPVVALLRAVHDALDIPLPSLADEDERAYAKLLARRATDARVILACVLRKGYEADGATASLRSWTTDQPVTYTPWPDDGSAP